MQQVLCIAALGAIGCLSRYFLSGWVYKICGNAFPYGTLVVNIVGAFLIGLIMEFSMRSALVPPVLRVAVTVGFLGGLTTFSTFSLESFRLLEEGQFVVAFFNMLLSVVACLACTWLGVATARSL
ncbi:fluoride efflux transporter CrcB [Geomonas sp. RF6]|uniref:fluoride efflux transporter CrcB n=1 Tax=Geomonas sp. RF6 TaxID=2897342 RepID=UPI001E53576C|nr:fluoride efflux transporter CrcB [Geomonas sp. RF6]UFS71506.1 fluoride efflux transporter CrcB [Geomonas sp. RF6]